MNYVNPRQQRFYGRRRSQACQNILYKAVFEHSPTVGSIAPLLLASSSFQNSSLGANFLLTFKIDEGTIHLFHRIMTPSSCFSLQFATSIDIDREQDYSEEDFDAIKNFVVELAKTKYFSSNLTSFKLSNIRILRNLFGNSTLFPKLRSFSVALHDLDEKMMALIAASAPHLKQLSVPGCNVSDLGLEKISSLLKDLESLNVSDSLQITDAGLKTISKLGNITSLNVSCCDSITNAGLAHVAKLSGITSLDVFGCGLITDVGLREVSKLPGITNLDLSSCCLITDAGIEHISKLVDVTSLKLFRCNNITDAGLEHIAKLSNITSLELGSCRSFTDAGLQHLSALVNIKSLDLLLCEQITDAGLEHIAKLSSITSLNLSGCYLITDAGIAHISKLPRLACLSLSSCDRITDAGVGYIASIPNLTSLNMWRCDKLSAEAKKIVDTFQ